MSTRCSVYDSDSGLVSVWRDAIGGDHDGLVLDVGWQDASASTPAQEVHGARIPLDVCVAIAQWVAKEGYLDPNSWPAKEARKAGFLK